jgi:large subunit ribosomal protein L24e
MVVKRQCSFCASEIEPGTGWMFVKRDGTVFHFCSSSCRKQQLHLGRVGHRFKWTRAHALRVASDRSATEKSPARARPHAAARPRRSPEPGTAPAPPKPAPEPGAPAPAAEPPAAPAAAPSKPRRPRKKPAAAPAKE